jgi:hypothetical protein
VGHAASARTPLSSGPASPDEEAPAGRAGVRDAAQDTAEGTLAASPVSKRVNTSFIERQNGTDRHRNSRKVRKTYRFSKKLAFHEAATYFTMYSYNFCWPVRTLREQYAPGCYRDRTPAMAAHLSDHVWTLEEWLRYPAKPS